MTSVLFAIACSCSRSCSIWFSTRVYAVKHANAGPSRVRIRVCCDDQNAALVSVEDSGVGLSAEECEHESWRHDPNIQGIGRTNIVTKTSNNLSPEMFPEFITNLQYFYGAGAQPGFNARFIVAYDYTRAPYWPTSNTNFGGQYGASNNGDIAGTIYRLLGGVVLRNKDQTPNYAGYQATAFILPKGTNNNRIIGPGDENLPSPDNKSARFFLVQ